MDMSWTFNPPSVQSLPVLLLFFVGVTSLVSFVCPSELALPDPVQGFCDSSEVGWTAATTMQLGRMVQQEKDTGREGREVVVCNKGNEGVFPQVGNLRRGGDVQLKRHNDKVEEGVGIEGLKKKKNRGGGIKKRRRGCEAGHDTGREKRMYVKRPRRAVGLPGITEEGLRDGWWLSAEEGTTNDDRRCREMMRASTKGTWSTTPVHPIRLYLLEGWLELEPPGCWVRVEGALIFFSLPVFFSLSRPSSSLDCEREEAPELAGGISAHRQDGAPF